MTEAVTKTRSPRRSAEDLAKEAQAKANGYRAKVGKAKRATETRQKVIAGSGLIGLAASGDAEAMRVLERVKANLTRPQDRAAFGLTKSAQLAVPAEDPGGVSETTKEELRAAITKTKEALMRLPSTPAKLKSPEQAAWVEAVVKCERVTGEWGTLPDLGRRQLMGLGGLGQTLAELESASRQRSDAEKLQSDPSHPHTP